MTSINYALSVIAGLLAVMLLLGCINDKNQQAALDRIEKNLEVVAANPATPEFELYRTVGSGYYRQVARAAKRTPVQPVVLRRSIYTKLASRPIDAEPVENITFVNRDGELENFLCILRQQTDVDDFELQEPTLAEPGEVQEPAVNQTFVDDSIPVVEEIVATDEDPASVTYGPVQLGPVQTVKTTQLQKRSRVITERVPVTQMVERTRTIEEEVPVEVTRQVQTASRPKYVAKSVQVPVKVRKTRMVTKTVQVPEVYEVVEYRTETRWEPVGYESVEPTAVASQPMSYQPVAVRQSYLRSNVYQPPVSFLPPRYASTQQLLPTTSVYGQQLTAMDCDSCQPGYAAAGYGAVGYNSAGYSVVGYDSTGYDSTGYASTGAAYNQPVASYQTAPVYENGQYQAYQGPVRTPQIPIVQAAPVRAGLQGAATAIQHNRNVSASSNSRRFGSRLFQRSGGAYQQCGPNGCQIIE